jgi:two-component system nitrogen regulation sensor histidine kinase NtrY
MKFRAKLTIAFMLTLLASTAAFAWCVTRYMRGQFDRQASQRSAALTSQFKRELAERGEEIVHSVEVIAEAEGTVRMALELTRPQADPSIYSADATGLASSHHLDFLEIANDDGTLVSSAQNPARAGHAHEWVTLEKDWDHQASFLSRVDLADHVELGMLAVRPVHVGNKKIYIVGGQRLDRNFLRALVPPSGMRVLLYENLDTAALPAALTDSEGPVSDAQRFLPLIALLRNEPVQTRQAASAQSHELPAADPRQAASAEIFVALPLAGRANELLALLLVGSSHSELVAFLSYTRSLSLLIAATGILICIFLSGWIAARITSPLARMTAAVRDVRTGKWNTNLQVRAPDEAGELAGTLNEAMQYLSDERERLLQAERVAAWREVARRLANELKDPLFPLQVTIGNLIRAREQAPEQLGDLVAESAPFLERELEHLRTIAGRFGEFAKMPPPRLQSVNLNDVVRAAVRTLEPKFSAIGRPQITPELYLQESVEQVQADPAVLEQAIGNLLTISADAMSTGGALTIRTAQKRDTVKLEITDTGAGNRGVNGRMFTPYESGRQSLGLGLATVQSIVTDHGGKMYVESAPGAGTTFRIELPAGAAASNARPTSALPNPDQVRRQAERGVPEREDTPSHALSSTSTD